jgi:rfaE bifunctional protein kinase chain/domain
LKTYTASQLKKFFSQLKHLKVFVVGDAMLDNYWIGHIDRISPEAPVPVVSVTQKDSRPGGAANVALNCNALGAEVYLFTVIGQDDTGKNLITQLKENQINTEYIISSKERITTSKTRILAKNQQIVRIDEEITTELSIKDEHHFIDTCLKAIQIEKPDILIFEDYNKGVLKKNVIEKIITHCKHVGVFTAVDPKQTNFLSYQSVDLFKPNLKEVKEALGIAIPAVKASVLKDIHTQLKQTLNHHITFITLSEAGVFFQENKMSKLLPAHVRRISDVSGAGDTVIAVATLFYVLTKDMELSAEMANLAGGLVCEEVGVIPINKAKLLQEALIQIQ